MRTAAIGACLALLASSCSATHPGAQPDAQSAAAHDREAAKHDAAAEAQEAEYEAAKGNRFPCMLLGSRGARAESSCWNEMENPTSEHLRIAEEQRERAEEHRAASEALRDAEAQTCRGIPASDRDTSPFQHPRDITGSEKLTDPSGRIVGARVFFRAIRGMTAETLQALVDCHIARNAVVGHEDLDPEGRDMPDCPLVPRHVHAKVSATASGFAVEVRSDDPASSAAIWARVQRLGGATGKAP